MFPIHPEQHLHSPCSIRILDAIEEGDREGGHLQQLRGWDTNGLHINEQKFSNAAFELLQGFSMGRVFWRVFNTTQAIVLWFEVEEIGDKWKIERKEDKTGKIERWHHNSVRAKFAGNMKIRMQKDEGGWKN
jgi:hypothetical protein